MNIRPRCGEWLPLSTQQLRLRNLQAVHGVNIELNDNIRSNLISESLQTQTLLYYTLHDHPKNEPFYQSEKLTLRKHLNLKWAEIQCPEMLKSNSNCVCIKVWIYVHKTESFEIPKNYKTKADGKQFVRKNEGTMLRANEVKEPSSALPHEFVKFKKLPRPSDHLLFSWGVYFSGLIPLSQNTDIKCCSNSLIFQMNDEYFASSERLNTECLRGLLALNYERYSASVPKCSVQTPDEFNINSPQVSRSSSPATVDGQKDLLLMSKTRYLQLNCERSAVRRSYDLTKLLRLQQLQRQRLQINRECVEMTEEIKRISLRCITKEQLLRKPRTTSINSSTSSFASTASQYHSMGRTLSLLLAEQHHVDPHQLLQAQQLQQELESLKSSQRLLISAKETFCNRISHLKKQIIATTTAREQLKDWLCKQRRKLQDDNLKLQHSLVEKCELFQRRCAVTQHVERIMYSLCLELRDIYPIERNSQGLYTICGVPFPRLSVYDLGTHNVQGVGISDNITPMALSASLGYVAHLIQMISVILNCPLRNPIIHEGSRTRVMDAVRDIPSYTSREFPLYSRSSIPTKPVRYAISLLNQNIAQLCFDITGTRCETHATTDNLLMIYATFIQMQQNKSEVYIHKRNVSTRRSNVIVKNNSDETDGSHHLLNYNHDQEEHNLPSQVATKIGEPDFSLSKSNSSIDMNQLIPPTAMMHHFHNNMPVFSVTSDKIMLTTEISSHPIDIHNRSVLITTNPQRSCRSVGSYTDSEEEVCHATAIKSFSNSDSNLTSLQRSDHHHI